MTGVLTAAAGVISLSVGLSLGAVVGYERGRMQARREYAMPAESDTPTDD